MCSAKNCSHAIDRRRAVVVQLIKEGKLKVVGGVYDLQTGRVTPVTGS